MWHAKGTIRGFGPSRGYVNIAHEEKRSPAAPRAASSPAPGTVTDSAYTADDNNAGNTGATGNGFCLVTVG